MKIKRIFTAFIALLTLSLFSLSSFASFEGSRSPSLPRVLDYVDYLTDEQETEINNSIASFADQYHCDILVIFLNANLTGDALDEYAYDIFTRSYGYSGADGECWNGACLVVDFGSREYAVQTYDYMYRIIGDYGRDLIRDHLESYLREGDYVGACKCLVSDCAGYAAKADIPADQYYLDYDHQQKIRRPIFYIGPVIIGMIISFFVSLGVVKKNKKQLIMVVPKNDAEGYFDDGSLMFTNHDDVFLTSVVTKIPRATAVSSSSGSHSSGGHSSGGHSYGSSHGHF